MCNLVMKSENIVINTDNIQLQEILDGSKDVEHDGLVVADGSVIVVLRHTLGDADRLDRMVLRVCEGLKQGTMFLVAAGGGHDKQMK